MKKPKSLKITPIKGRPMLHWVGKKPLDVVRHFPAQVCETVGVTSPPAEPSYREFKKNSYNLLFHGDNKEILSSLIVAGFRGKVALIYIDPPFDSGADYVRRVKLRGQSEKLEGEGHTSIEQAQYTDIWANDNYLQFMYERLILMRELLSDKGSIYLHCDWHKNHHLRFLLDEVFGEENFVNEVVWYYKDASGIMKKGFRKKHDTVLIYAKSEKFYFNSDVVRQDYGASTKKAAESGTVSFGRPTKINSLGKYPDDVLEISIINSQAKERLNFPTQKPEDLLERIIKASSDDGSIVLDCFCGSGTAAAVAEKLGRRWIMADLNKGAIKTTMKRLQGIINRKNGDLAEKNGRGFIHYRVNNYDFAKQIELKKIIISKYGVQKDNGDLFFDGLYQGQLAKIIDLNRPLTRLDIQIIKDEIQNNRPEETRDITVFCNGSELEIINELAQDKNPINKIKVCDIQQDGMVTNQPAEADVCITKQGVKAEVMINDYISPSILARMDIDRTIFDEQIDDFRAQIDCVLIDNDYDGERFNIVESDLPQRKTDYIRGEYLLTLPHPDAKVAVKIVDMLGEEVVVVR